MSELEQNYRMTLREAELEYLDRLARQDSLERGLAEERLECIRKAREDPDISFCLVGKPPDVRKGFIDAMLIWASKGEEEEEDGGVCTTAAANLDGDGAEIAVEDEEDEEIEEMNEDDEDGIENAVEDEEGGAR